MSDTVRFSSKLELLKHVQRAYRGVDCLSSDELNRCYYKHDINGVGCAIGCLFSEKEAAIFGDDAISLIIERENTPGHDLVSNLLPGDNVEEKREFLQTIQYLHDRCADYSFGVPVFKYAVSLMLIDLERGEFVEDSPWNTSGAYIDEAIEELEDLLTASGE